MRAMAVSAEKLPEYGGYDLITCLDSFHHFGDPRAVARSAQRGLGDGGVFLVAESATSGELAQDAQSPFSLITYRAGLLYCLQENLAGGGSGLPGGDGPSGSSRHWKREALPTWRRTTPRPATASSSRRSSVVPLRFTSKVARRRPARTANLMVTGRPDCAQPVVLICDGAGPRRPRP